MDSLQKIAAEFDSQTNNKQSLAFFKTYQNTMALVEKSAINMYNTSLHQGSLINVITSLHLKSKAFELTEETREVAKIFSKPNMLQKLLEAIQILMCTHPTVLDELFNKC